MSQTEKDELGKTFGTKSRDRNPMFSERPSSTSRSLAKSSSRTLAKSSSRTLMESGKKKYRDAH
jgi:hypothetical protein